MSRRILRAVQTLLWKSLLPEHALTVVPWFDGDDVELRAWIDPAFVSGAVDIPRTILGLQVRVLVKPMGTPHVDIRHRGRAV